MKTAAASLGSPSTPATTGSAASGQLRQQPQTAQPEQQRRADQEQRHGLAEVPPHAQQRLAHHVPELRQPERRQFHDEFRTLAGDRPRREEPHEEHLRQHDTEQRDQRGERHAAENAEDRRELRRARDAQRQQQHGDQPLLGRAEDPRGHRRHRVAAEAQHHGEHGLAVEPHDAEDPIAEDRQPRDVAGILQEPEHEEERGHHRQHDGDGVGQAHRDEAVLADQEVPGHRPGHRAIDERDRARIDDPLEQPRLR